MPRSVHGGVTEETNTWADSQVLRVRNFKSIKAADIPLAPFTIIYGPNGSGKSSLLHAILALKNIAMNPNQAPGGFFNFGYANLGGLPAVAHNHSATTPVEISLSGDANGEAAEFKVVIAENQGKLVLTLQNGPGSADRFDLSVSFPYPLNQGVKRQISREGHSFNLTWNGVTGQIEAGSSSQELLATANAFLAFVNGITGGLKNIAVVPPMRSFTEPQYAAAVVSPLAVKAEEVATILSNEKYLEQRVSHYLEKIVDRDFRVHTKPATSFFTLDVTDRRTGMGTELVNDGSGVGQLVYLLARCLQESTTRVCIEEPELHLHPTAVRRLASALVDIYEEDGKRFLINTQSEAFIVSILALVRTGRLKASEVAIFLARKERKVTTFERQVVNDRGQVEGGLASFVEAELEDIRAFLGEDHPPTSGEAR